MFSYINKLALLVLSLILTLTLAFATSTQDHDPLSTAPYLQQQQVSQFDKLFAQQALLPLVHPASLFGHVSQQKLDYIYLIVVALFVCAAVSYRFYRALGIAPPWYLQLRRNTRFRRQAWSLTNQLYNNKIIPL